MKLITPGTRFISVFRTLFPSAAALTSAMAFTIGVALTVAAAPPAAAQETVYADSLAGGWQDYSWATVDTANPSPVFSGTASIQVEPDFFEALYIHSDSNRNSDLLGVLSFQALAPTGSVSLSVALIDTNGTETTVLASESVIIAQSPDWQNIEIDFVELGVIAQDFDGFWLQDTTGVDQPTLYVDAIELEPSDSVPPSGNVQIDIQTQVDRRPVDPRVYGVNFGEAAAFANVAYPFRRWGGNSVTRYNWQTDTSQVASDYFFQSIVAPVVDEAALPFGTSSDVFVAETLAAGREVLITVPIIGWTAPAERIKQWSFSVQKYGPQTVDECSFYNPNPPFWCTADSGNGECDPAINTTGFCGASGEIVGNDPADASLAIDSSFVANWMTHLFGQFGTASSGGVRNYALDNEPMLWDSTHRDVHPNPATYDEVWSRSLDIATTIKATDPDAHVFGPAVWGWCAYFSSAADLAAGNCFDGADRAAHGGLAFIPWYLEQVCSVEAATGTRPVDVLDIHYYPQGDVSGLGGASDSEAPAAAARRLRSIKELYDPAYTSESWIGEPVALIPLMRGWIDQHCPGMDLALTEYKWGTDDGISSALAHAEALAIFGREGLDIATRWTSPGAGTRVEDAYRLFLDFDGMGGQVLGDSIRTTSSDVDLVGAYSIQQGDELNLLLFNKSTAMQEVAVSIDGTLLSALSLYRFDSTSGLAASGTVATLPGSATIALPPRSATLARGIISVPEPGLTARSLALGLLSLFGLRGRRSGACAG